MKTLYMNWGGGSDPEDTTGWQAGSPGSVASQALASNAWASMMMMLLMNPQRTPEHRTPTANNYSEQLQRTTTANNYSALVQTPERGRRTKSGPALNNVWVLWARVAFDLLLRVGVH